MAAGMPLVASTPVATTRLTMSREPMKLPAMGDAGWEGAGTLPQGTVGSLVAHRSCWAGTGDGQKLPFHANKKASLVGTRHSGWTTAARSS